MGTWTPCHSFRLGWQGKTMGNGLDGPGGSYIDMIWGLETPGPSLGNR